MTEPGEATRTDIVFGAVAWLILAPLALFVVGGLVYEAVVTAGRFFGW